MFIQPHSEVIKMLELLNTVSNTYLIGRSLISKSSKDIDFMIIGTKDDYNKIKKLEDIKPFIKRYSDSHEYISEDFPWDALISGKNDFFDFDILFCSFENNIEDILKGFPITSQHIAFDGVETFHTKHFQVNYLELSPERRQKEYSEELKKVMKKYCEYYPDHGIGDIFFDALKKFAFQEDLNFPDLNLRF